MRKVWSFVTKYSGNEKGMSCVEYALLLALIGAGLAAISYAFGSGSPSPPQ